MENAKIGERSATSLATASLVVKMYEILPLRHKKTKKNITPMESDVNTDIIVANLASFEFPLPIAFDTLTLYVYITFSVSIIIHVRVINLVRNYVFVFIYIHS